MKSIRADKRAILFAVCRRMPIISMSEEIR